MLLTLIFGALFVAVISSTYSYYDSFQDGLQVFGEGMEKWRKWLPCEL